MGMNVNCQYCNKFYQCDHQDNTVKFLFLKIPRECVKLNKPFGKCKFQKKFMKPMNLNKLRRNKMKYTQFKDAIKKGNFGITTDKALVRGSINHLLAMCFKSGDKVNIKHREGFLQIRTERIK